MKKVETRKLVPFRLPLDLIASIKKRAAEDERTINAWVIRALRRAVRRNG